MKLNASKSEATLTLQGNFSADALEELISKLAVLRSDMQPPVPKARPDSMSEADKHITIEDEPAMVVARLRDGRFRLWLRNRGTGWMAYNIDAANATGLRDYLSANLPTTPDRANLFGEQDGELH